MKVKFLAFFLIWATGNTCYAGGIGSPARELVELKDAILLAEPASRSIILPINKFASLEQLTSNLCWAFAFLSAVEATYMAHHPDSQVVLSRGLLQYFIWQERFEAWKNKDIFYLKESSTADDAYRMLKTYGIVQSKDYKGYATRVEDYLKKETTEKKLWSRDEKEQLRNDIFKFYFPAPPPNETKFENTSLTSLEFSKKILDNHEWKTFAVALDDIEGIGPHYDKDASPELKIEYIKRSKIKDILLKSLQNKNAVYISFSGPNLGHALTLYGVDYSQDGRPLRFYMKDSYPDYFFIGSPEEVIKNLRAITVIP